MLGKRACMCHDTYSAHQGVEHGYRNVFDLETRILGTALPVELVATLLDTRFQEGEERFVRRWLKVEAIEALHG